MIKNLKTCNVRPFLCMSVNDRIHPPDMHLKNFEVA